MKRVYNILYYMLLKFQVWFSNRRARLRKHTNSTAVSNGLVTFAGLQIPNLPCQYPADSQQTDWRNSNFPSAYNVFHHSFSQDSSRPDCTYFNHGQQQEKEAEHSDKKNNLCPSNSSVASGSGYWNKSSEWGQIGMGLQPEGNYGDFLAAQQQFANASNKYWA